MRNEKVHQWMSYPVVTIAKTATLLQASNLMHQYDIHHLPVVQEVGGLCGVLSYNDIRGVAPEQMNEPLTVEHVMTKKPVTVLPNATLAEASVKLMVHHVGCLPVVDKDKLVGILTESDIFAVLAKNWRPLPTTPYARYSS